MALAHPGDMWPLDEREPEPAKPGSLKRAGSADASVNRMRAIGEELREARREEAVFRKHGLYCHTLASVTKQVALLEEANQIAEQWNSHRLNEKVSDGAVGKHGT